jgi:hypothetical protein
MNAAEVMSLQIDLVLIRCQPARNARPRSTRRSNFVKDADATTLSAQSKICERPGR